MKYEPIAKSEIDWTRIIWPMLICLALVVLRPVPLVGGQTDDYKYLLGAHCIDCLPTNHWERRFPIVWPTGIALKLPIPDFYAVMIWPVASSVACIAMLYALVEREWDRKAAVLAATALALTPIFANRSMRIGVDIIELAFLLGSILLLQRGKGHHWAGALLALAVLCRPTQLAALPLVTAYSWWLDRTKMLRFLAGFSAPLLAESAIYWIATGDPLYSWKLSLNHARHPSFLLDPSVDYTKSPLFNPDFIGGWLPISGIDAHWTVRGISNLLTNPQSAPPIIAALLVWLASWRIDRKLVAIVIAAALFFGALTYAFGVDPRPRMFLPVYCAAAAVFGATAAGLKGPRAIILPFVISALALMALVGLVSYRTDYTAEARTAAETLRREPREIDQPTRERISLFYWNAPSTTGAPPLRVGRPCIGSCLHPTRTIESQQVPASKLPALVTK